MHSKNLRAYLDSAAAIAALLPQAERLIELRRTYSEIVPQQLLRSSSIVNYKQGNVVIFADNNAIAAKLKLLTPRLIDDFSRCGVQVTGIRIEVQPRETPKLGSNSGFSEKRAKLSMAGVERLEVLSERLPDSRLRRTIAGMAARGASDQRMDQPSQDNPDQAGRSKAK